VTDSLPDSENDSAEEATVPIKQSDSISSKLARAISKQEVGSIVQTALFAKLKIISGPELHTGVDELGVDSLNASDLRSWIMENLKVDVPVLSILTEATVGELLDLVLAQVPFELTPALAESDLDATPGSSDVDSDSLSGFSGLTPEPSGSESDEQPTYHVSTQQDLSRGTIIRTERMSFGQARFWFLRSYLEDSTPSNITATYRVVGDLRTDDLARAVQLVGQWHEALRTCFYVNPKTGESQQGILSTGVLTLERNYVMDKDCYKTEVARLLKHQYDLENGETMKIVLLSVSPTTHFLIIAYHHFNMDGISLQVCLL